VKTCCRKEWREEVVARSFEVVASGNCLQKPDYKVAFMITTT
jgi:hypothetical protein